MRAGFSSVLCSLLLASKAASFGVAPLNVRKYRSSNADRDISLSLSAFPFPYESFDSVTQSVTHLWEIYGTLLREQPVETKSITAATLASTGDAVAQFLSSRKNESEAFQYDPRRGAAFLAFGALYTGCFQHYWFDFLEKHILDWGENLYLWGHPAQTSIPVTYFVEKEEWWQYFDLVSQIEKVMATLKDPPSQEMVAAAKLAVNQFLVIPLLYMPLFFGITGALGGLDVSKSIARARSLYVPILQRNYFFWLPIQFIQFLFLPVDYQIPFVCAASLCWTIILSSIGGSPTVAPSSIVTYETAEADGSSEAGLVTALSVDAGAVNEMIDAVYLEDVQKALVPKRVSSAVDDAIGDIPQFVGTSAKGLTAGLLAAAADDAAIGSAVGGMLGAEATVGIAIVAAVGAGVGYLSGAADGKADSTTVDDSLSLELVEVDSDDAIPAYQMMNSTASEAFASVS